MKDKELMLKTQAEEDQARAYLAEALPSMWMRMYKNLQSEGFDKVDAFKALQTYILSNCPFGVRGVDK